MTEYIPIFYCLSMYGQIFKHTDRLIEKFNCYEFSITNKSLSMSNLTVL